jgi:hypothetical protein
LGEDAFGHRGAADVAEADEKYPFHHRKNIAASWLIFTQLAKQQLSFAESCGDRDFAVAF